MRTAADFEFTAPRVKEIRLLLGETQGKFAERLGVEKNMINRWETGKNTPRVGRVIAALLLAERAAGLA